ERELDTALKEVNDLGPKIKRAQSVDGAIDNHEAHRVSRGAVASIPARGEHPHIEQRDERPQSLGHRFVESDDFKLLQERKGQGAAHMKLDSFHEERALVSTGTLPTDYLEPMRIPGFQRGSDPFG